MNLESIIIISLYLYLNCINITMFKNMESAISAIRSDGEKVLKHRSIRVNHYHI
jgi:hypothetical protein